MLKGSFEDDVPSFVSLYFRSGQEGSVGHDKHLRSLSCCERRESQGYAIYWTDIRKRGAIQKEIEMITRSNLAEQLRDYQIRSQHNWASLSFFSSTAQITSRGDAAKAGLWGLLFLALLIFSFIALYFRYAWLGFTFVCLAIFLPICLKIVRQRLARKRQRRLQLPLSM